MGGIRILTLAEASAIYNIGWETGITVQKLAWPTLYEDFKQAFRAAKRELLCSAGPLEYSYMHRMSELMFALTHLPLPSNHVRFKKILRQSCITGEVFTTLHELAQQVLSASEDPFGATLANLISLGPPKVALLLANDDWCASVAERFGHRGRLRVACSFDSSWMERTYDRIVVVGAIRNHPEHIYTAPRSFDIQWLVAPWMRGTFEPSLLSEPVSSASWERPRIIYHSPATAEDDAEDSATQLLVGPITEASLFAAADVIGREAMARAAMISFDHGLYAYYPIEGESIDVVSEANDLKINRVPVSKVRAGDLVLEIEGGTWEYNAKVADDLIGAEGVKQIRSALARWEAALGELIEQEGLDGLAFRLERELGRGVSGNVVLNWAQHAWTRGGTILPNDEEDFRVAASFAGLSTVEIDNAWRWGKLLRVTRRKAGHIIRKQMRKELAENLASMRSSVFRTNRFVLDFKDNRRIYVLRALEVESDVGVKQASIMGRLLTR